MKRIVFLACRLASFLVPSVAYPCDNNHYEQCYRVCVLPRPFVGGCAQEAKDCKCLPKIDTKLESLGQNIITTIRKANGDTITTLQKAGRDTITTVVKAGGDSIDTFVQAGKDATATYVKAWRDTSEQTKRSFQDTVDAASAVANYTANQVRSYESTLRNAEKRLREGKVIDAMWGLGVEPLQATDANFAKATQESKVIAAAASSAAAVYAGPGGAAAYAAWATYRATGDADQALRAGFLAAATAQAGSAVSSMPSGTLGEVVKKSAVAGAAGGIAVAAAGGDEQAIKEGFLKSAGAVLVQTGNEKAKAFSPKAKDAWDTVQCISARDVDCVSSRTWARDAKGRILKDAQGKPRVDTTKLDPKHYIGKWTGIDPNSIEGKQNALISKISQLPKIEAIPLMKNRWVLSWTTGKAGTIGYARPTVVLTYVGPSPQFTSKVTYGRGSATTLSGVSGSAAPFSRTYECTLAGIDRTIFVTLNGGGCKAVYRRADGVSDVLFQSVQDSEICLGKAAQFVTKMRAKGMQCQS